MHEIDQKTRMRGPQMFSWALNKVTNLFCALKFVRNSGRFSRSRKLKNSIWNPGLSKENAGSVVQAPTHAHPRCITPCRAVVLSEAAERASWTPTSRDGRQSALLTGASCRDQMRCLTDKCYHSLTVWGRTSLYGKSNSKHFQTKLHSCQSDTTRRTHLQPSNNVNDIASPFRLQWKVQWWDSYTLLTKKMRFFVVRTSENKLCSIDSASTALQHKPIVQKKRFAFCGDGI